MIIDSINKIIMVQNKLKIEYIEQNIIEIPNFNTFSK